MGDPTRAREANALRMTPDDYRRLTQHERDQLDAWVAHHTPFRSGEGIIREGKTVIDLSLGEGFVDVRYFVGTTRTEILDDTARVLVPSPPPVWKPLAAPSSSRSSTGENP